MTLKLASSSDYINLPFTENTGISQKSSREAVNPEPGLDRFERTKPLETPVFPLRKAIVKPDETLQSKRMQSLQKAYSGGHWGLDVATSVALVGAAVGFPPLAAVAPALLSYSIWGHVASLGFHAAKAGINLSDPINGATFSERLNKYMNMQSATSLAERVFQGKEPLAVNRSQEKK